MQTNFDEVCDGSAFVEESRVVREESEGSLAGICCRASVN